MSKPAAAHGYAETKATGFVEIYSNSTRVVTSPWDMSIMFGTIADQQLDEGQDVVAKAIVRMSPQQFKVLATTLPRILASWEARFGAVAVPPSLLASPDEITASMAAGQPALPAPPIEGPAPMVQKRPRRWTAQAPA